MKLGAIMHLWAIYSNEVYEPTMVLHFQKKHNGHVHDDTSVMLFIQT